MKNIDMLKELFDKKILEILKLFLQNREKQFYLREISNLSNVPVATVYRIVNKLVSLGFIQETQISKFKIYQQGKGEKARFLEELFRGGADPLQTFIEQLKSVNEINKILIEEKKNDSAKFLFVGENVPTKKIEKFCKEVKENSNIEINFLILSPTQFEKMREIGLYSEKDKLLWQRI